MLCELVKPALPYLADVFVCLILPIFWFWYHVETLTCFFEKAGEARAENEKRHLFNYYSVGCVSRV